MIDMVLIALAGVVVVSVVWEICKKVGDL